MTVIRNKEIFERYEELMVEENNFGNALTMLSEENDIGESYVKNILKDYGVEIQNNRSKEEKGQRDANIVELYMAGDEQDDIAEKFDLTITRIGQIIRSHLGRHAKNTMLEKSLTDLKKDIDTGKSHKNILRKYGASLLRKLKSNLGYNAFDACLEKRNKNIHNLYIGKIDSKLREFIAVRVKKRKMVALTLLINFINKNFEKIVEDNIEVFDNENVFSQDKIFEDLLIKPLVQYLKENKKNKKVLDKLKSKKNLYVLLVNLNINNKKYTAIEISSIYGLTRDHVYGILHDFGVRTKPTKEEYKKRNDAIVKEFQKEGKTSQEIADKYGKTVTNINIILKNHGARLLMNN